MSIGLAATMMHEAVYYESLVTTPVTTNTATTTLAPSNGTAPITEIPPSATAAITTVEAEEQRSSVEPAVDVPENGSSGASHEEDEVTDLIPPSTRSLDSPVGSGRGKAESLVAEDTPTLTFPTEHVETDMQPTNGTAGEMNEVGPRTPANSPSLKQAALTLALSSSTPTAPTTTTPAPTTTTAPAPPLDYNKLSLELKQMAFTTAQGIHDAGWVDFGYQFATPEVSVFT